MALSAAVLSSDMIAQLTVTFGRSPDDPVQAARTTLALATAIVNHIKNTAVVTVTGVTAGGATAGGTIT